MSLLSRDLPPIAKPDDFAEMASAGNVAGLLAALRERSLLQLPAGALDDLATAIRALQLQNVDTLVDQAYAELVGFIMMLLVRYEIHVERRFAQAGAHGGDPTHVPCDLIDEDWFGRIERLARFLMEISTTRERVRHLARLNTHVRGIRLNPEWLGDGSLAADRNPAAPGKKASRNGRNGSAAGRFQFP